MVCQQKFFFCFAWFLDCLLLIMVASLSYGCSRPSVSNFDVHHRCLTIMYRTVMMSFFGDFCFLVKHNRMVCVLCKHIHILLSKAQNVKCSALSGFTVFCYFCGLISFTWLIKIIMIMESSMSGLSCIKPQVGKKHITFKALPCNVCSFLGQGQLWQ